MSQLLTSGTVEYIRTDRKPFLLETYTYQLCYTAAANRCYDVRLSATEQKTFVRSYDFAFPFAQHP